LEHITLDHLGIGAAKGLAIFHLFRIPEPNSSARMRDLSLGESSL
jgi:hypothetical protein